MFRCLLNPQTNSDDTLGAGFFEKVYENALMLELREAGFTVAQQHGATVRYKDTVVGEYFINLRVDDAVLVALTAVKALDEAHCLQCVNDLKATGLDLCLLLNFGNPCLEIKRLVRRL